MNELKYKVGIIILAAGSSSRFGEPKQLMKFKAETLLQHAVESAIKSDCFPVVAVLGANFEKIENEIKCLDCEIVFNTDWQTGMSSSIKIGVEKMLELAPEISAVIFSLCDQPFIKSEHINKLVEKFIETKKPIVASFYNEIIGVPALFAKEMFSGLSNLEGDKGAKEIIRKNPESVEKIFLPEGVIDIDTKADFEKLKNSETKN